MSGLGPTIPPNRPTSLLLEHSPSGVSRGGAVIDPLRASGHATPVGGPQRRATVVVVAAAVEEAGVGAAAAAIVVAVVVAAVVAAAAVGEAGAGAVAGTRRQLD